MNRTTRAVVILILLTTALRLVFAKTLGLGIDESYMVALGRDLHLSYFDHPPVSWWLQWGASHLFGSEDALVVRLPFIGLFAVSTWLMYRLTSLLFSETAGVWAAVALNISPVFGYTSASWVLPDGPLDAALLGFLICLVRAVEPEGRHPWIWWLGVGITAGVALLSKYIAVLILAGAAVALLAHPVHRRWARRPHPWLAVVVAGLIFSPVVVWNAQHQWCSVAFQGGRALGHDFHLFAPLVILGGEALYLLPWIWVPVVIELYHALRRGPGDWPRWLLSCCGLLPIVLFATVGLWSHSRILYHWAAPGYLVLFPLLGAALARWTRNARPAVWIKGAGVLSAGLVLSGAAIVNSEVLWNWLPAAGENFQTGKDPDLAAVDWTSLVPEMEARGLIGAGKPAIAALRWHEAGKLDYALGGRATVLCLGDDPREYGIVRPAAGYQGQDLLVLAPEAESSRVEHAIRGLFESVEPVQDLTVRHGDEDAMRIAVYIGHNFLSATKYHQISME